MSETHVPDLVRIRLVSRVEDGPGKWGSLSHGEVIEDARDWAAIEAAIDRLDGATFNEVTVNRCPTDVPSVADCDTLFLGGGEDDRVCVVFGCRVEGGVATFALVEPARGDAIETRTYGGQGTEMPARRWVAKDAAVAAARYFVEQGGREPDAIWELDFFEPD